MRFLEKDEKVGMNFKFQTTATLIILAVFWANPAQAYRDVVYLGDEAYSEAVQINNNNQIIGYHLNLENGWDYYNACLFDVSGETVVHRTIAGGPSDSYAHGINDNGQAVGEFYSEGIMNAIIFGSGGRLIGDPYGGISSRGYAINNSGQAVGQFGDKAYIFNSQLDATVVYLGTGVALSINNSGKVVGNSGGNAVLFDTSGNENNIILGSGKAKSINDWDMIVGNSGGNAVLWYNGTETILGSGYANSINNNSDNFQIVGNSGGHGYLFDSTGQGHNIDLNTLIDPSSGWTITDAYSINNNGWIVGWGSYVYPGGGYEGPILIIPEPATILLLTLGGLVLRKKR
jgi:hypothetical protein